MLGGEPSLTNKQCYVLAWRLVWHSVSCYTLVEHWLRVHQYSSDNYMSSTVHLDRLDPTRLVVLATRRSRDMSSTVSVSDVVDVSDRCQRVLHMVRRNASKSEYCS